MLETMEFKDMSKAIQDYLEGYAKAVAQVISRLLLMLYKAI